MGTYFGYSIKPVVTHDLVDDFLNKALPDFDYSLYSVLNDSPAALGSTWPDRISSLLEFLRKSRLEIDKAKLEISLLHNEIIKNK